MYLKPMTTKPARNLGRYLRAGLGLGLLALFGYTLLPGVIYAQYPQGRVNAALITVRAPIDGQVSYSGLQVGQRVSRNQTLASLRDLPERDVRLANLLAQENNIAERAAGLERQIAALNPLLNRLDRDSRNFRKAVISSITAQMGEAEAQVRRAEASLRQLDAQLARIQTLANASFASKAELDRRRAEADVARAELAARRKTHDRLKQEREAAERGIYLSDSYNNAPYSQQRRDEIELQRLSLVNRLGELNAERSQILQQIEAERNRRQSVGDAVATAPAAGILWRVLEGDRATVGAGTPLAQVADCTQLFFEVAQDRRADETLSIGDMAEVELEHGGSRANHRVQLVGLRSEHDTARGELALNSPAAPDQLRWIFAFQPHNTPDGETLDSCPIGRTGRLHYSNTLLDRAARSLGLTARQS